MPRHYLVLHESWSLWIKGVKVTSDMLHRLYDHIHSKEALSYRSGKLSEQSLIAESVNWTAIHKAMKTISRGRRIFISKHSAGMCGVGKFMKRWKQRDTNACPRWGAEKDARRIWLCLNPEATEIWHQSITQLAEGMQSVDTHPELIHILETFLQGWRNGSIVNYNAPTLFVVLIEWQSYIGWERVIEGWLTIEWQQC